MFRRGTGHTDAGRGGTPSGLPGAPKPALPGLVYTNAHSSLRSFTAQSIRKRDTITTRANKVRELDVFLRILGIILGKNKLISAGSGTILKSRKSTLVNQNKY